MQTHSYRAGCMPSNPGFLGGFAPCPPHSDIYNSKQVGRQGSVGRFCFGGWEMICVEVINMNNSAQNAEYMSERRCRHVKERTHISAAGASAGQVPGGKSQVAEAIHRRLQRRYNQGRNAVRLPHSSNYMRGNGGHGHAGAANLQQSERRW